MHKIRTNHKHLEARVFAYMALLLGIGVSMLYPIFPNFVKTILKNDQLVSFYYAIMALTSLAAGLATTILFRKVTRTAITKSGLFILGIVYFTLIFTTRFSELAFLHSAKVIFELILLTALGLFVRDYANAKDLGKEEGYYYRYQNMGYLVGPFIGGFLAVNFDYEFVFLIAATIIFSSLGYFYHLHVVQKHPAIITQNKQTTHELISNIRAFFSNKNCAKGYLFNVFSMMWITFKRIYIPLFVIAQGYLESVSGILLSLAILPYILVEVKVGEYADKHGIQLPITYGLIIIGTFLTLSFFSPYTLLSFLFLLLANIGGAFLEPLGDYFIFKNSDKKSEEKLYGIYMTGDPISYFLTMACGGLILTFLPFNYLFLVFGILMFIGAALSKVTLKGQ